MEKGEVKWGTLGACGVGDPQAKGLGTKGQESWPSILVIYSQAPKARKELKQAGSADRTWGLTWRVFGHFCQGRRTRSQFFCCAKVTGWKGEGRGLVKLLCVGGVELPSFWLITWAIRSPALVSSGPRGLPTSWHHSYCSRLCPLLQASLLPQSLTG